MNKKIISYDLGTSGNKASLYDHEGNCLATAFVAYDTTYPHVGWHEQKPEDWWEAVVESTRQLLHDRPEDIDDIACIGISGHSLGVIPIDKKGTLLRSQTPIWSDIRAQQEVHEFFLKIDADEWYRITGNGFPAACYSIFKIMWYKNNEPEMYQQIYKVLGTKDFINLKLTGIARTDFSYASGCGVYNLKAWGYHQPFVQASGINPGLLPDIVPSTEVLGTLTDEAAKTLGLSPNTKVVCGGVDNSCMALGAKNIKEGRVYTSLGSSAWIAVSSSEPVIDPVAKPYVFAHVIPGMFTSAVSIFSAGTSFRWVRDNVCQDLIAKAQETKQDVYDLMTALAETAPVGSNKLLFNPSLAGGNSQDPSVNLRGAYVGMDLKHGPAELIRAAMEGIAMNLRLRLDILRSYCDLEEEVLLVGGGSKSRLYRQIFADVYNSKIIKTNIDQDAAALGAAALAAYGIGLWQDFSKIDQIHKIVEIIKPDPENNHKYEQLIPIFESASKALSYTSDSLHALNI